MSANDTVIDQAVILAEAGDLPGIHYARNRKKEIPGFRICKNRRWTQEEKQFLIDNYYSMPLEEIAAYLGRSTNACKIIIVRNCIPRPSKRKGWLTGNGVARVIGSDIHSIMLMHERGIMPFEVMPGERGILLIKKRRLFMWCINPMHWPYFRIENVRDKKLQRLVKLAQSRWNDEWMTTGQAGELLGVDCKLIYNRIRKGEIFGVRWDNWWVRRSEIENLVIHTGKGRRGVSKKFTPVADKFLVQSRMAGLTYSTIGRMMKVDSETVRNRWLYLRNRL